MLSEIVQISNPSKEEYLLTVLLEVVAIKSFVGISKTKVIALDRDPTIISFAKNRNKIQK